MKKVLPALLLAFSLLLSAVPFMVNAETASGEAGDGGKYALTDTIQAEVKSILNERTSGGTRLGVVVRLYNESSRIARIPDYELRAGTSGDIVYTLRPSAANAVAIQPQEKVELSYLVELDRSDEFMLTTLSWFDVDEFEYPKKENEVLKIPVDGLEWRGSQTLASSGEHAISWGEPFQLPFLSRSLVFTPVQALQQASSQGPVLLVVLLAENKSEMQEKLPDFRIDGNTEKKTYPGKRADKAPEKLEPGEKVYVTFSIPLENNATKLKSLTLLTPETFVSPAKEVTTYTVGRLNIAIPPEKEAPSIHKLAEYTLSQPIAIDPLFKLTADKVDISMVELHMHSAEGEGYRTAIAKFKLLNRSDKPVFVPGFQAEIVTEGGFSYMGSRQLTAAQTLLPNLGYIISYSFNLPNSESGSKLAINLLDNQIAAPYNLPIASYRTKAQPEAEEGPLYFYPFEVKLNDWYLGYSTLFGSGGLTYTYKLQLNLDIARQDNIVVDENFSKMKIELVNKLGKTIAAQSLPFTGTDRLISGDQVITFSGLKTDSYEFPLSIRFYESIATPFGEAKRLVRTLQQR
ncbi:hypothetical protein WBG83_10490 [Paenibacillus sp. y28]